MEKREKIILLITAILALVCLYITIQYIAKKEKLLQDQKSVVWVKAWNNTRGIVLIESPDANTSGMHLVENYLDYTGLRIYGLNIHQSIYGSADLENCLGALETITPENYPAALLSAIVAYGVTNKAPGYFKSFLLNSKNPAGIYKMEGDTLYVGVLPIGRVLGPILVQQVDDFVPYVWETGQNYGDMQIAQAAFSKFPAHTKCYIVSYGDGYITALNLSRCLSVEGMTHVMPIGFGNIYLPGPDDKGTSGLNNDNSAYVARPVIRRENVNVEQNHIWYWLFEVNNQYVFARNDKELAKYRAIKAKQIYPKVDLTDAVSDDIYDPVSKSKYTDDIASVFFDSEVTNTYDPLQYVRGYISYSTGVDLKSKIEFTYNKPNEKFDVPEDPNNPGH